MMITMAEALQKLNDTLDQMTLEEYIGRTWVRPIKKHQSWYFEEIDISRIRLVHHLRQDIMVNDDAMDVVLHLLDQVYGLREQMRKIKYTLDSQPQHIQIEISSLLKEMENKYTDV
jgi:chaperone modulatory protein CbpM